MRPFRILFCYNLYFYLTAVHSTCLCFDFTRIPIVLDKPEDGANLDCNDIIIEVLFPIEFDS